MKKRKAIIASLILAIMVLFISACETNGCVLNSCTCMGNKQMFDFNYSFNYAIIELPNGQIVEGSIDTWNDYEDGDQIQVKINGVTYLVHSSKCVLMSK
jgi:hypothetical protein